jgi:hypothetical protein
MTGVADRIEQLAAVDVERLRSEDNFDDYSMRELAPDFGDSFAALSTLMTSKDANTQTGQTTPTLSSSLSGPKRPRPISLSSLPLKRQKGRRRSGRTYNCRSTNQTLWVTKIRFVELIGGIQILEFGEPNKMT